MRDRNFVRRVCAAARYARFAAVSALAALCLLAARPVVADAGDPDASDPAGGARVISIGGAVTEIVYALDMQDHLVAVDSTSLYPADTGDLPDVGYMRRLAAEPIIALDPTVVLAIEDAGPETVLDQLAAAGIRVVRVPDTATPAGVLDKIAVVADTLGREAAGAALSRHIADELARLDRAISAVAARPPMVFLLSVGRGAPMAAGRDTSADSIMALAGGRNAIDAFDGYKPLSPEAMVAAAPEVVLVTYRTVEALGGREAILARPEIANTPAGRSGRLVVMDGLLLLGFGPRTPEAVRSLAGALHEDLPWSNAERSSRSQ